MVFFGRSFSCDEAACCSVEVVKGAGGRVDFLRVSMPATWKWRSCATWWA